MSLALRKLALVAAGALALLGISAAPAGAAEEFDKFAIESLSVSLSDKQAGAHADMTIGVKLTRNGNEPYAKAQEIKIELPPGVIGNPQAVPRCTAEQLGSGFESSACPFDSQVGMSAVRTTKPFPNVFNEPVYNMVPPKGTDVVARLGFIAAAYPTFVNLRIDPTDYSVVATAEGLASVAGLSEATTTIWGVPAAEEHDEERITPEEAINGGTPPGGRSVSTPELPFLSNPTDCSLKREVTVTARSYQLPDQPSVKSIAFPDITGCGKLNFEPSFSTQLTNPEAAAPTGLDTDLVIPQDESPQGNAVSALKSARVTLPEGFTINAAAADGLQGCSAEQVGYGKNLPASCPDAAKIGSIEAEVPALEETLHGSVYQRTPEPGRLFGLWVVADEQGVHLKLPARIEPNPLTGQLTAVFDGIDTLGGLPQVPVAELKLNVFGGPRAPLATPGCGTYLTDYSFVPWSGRPPTQGFASMQVTVGCGKGGFSPRIQAGSLSPIGGAFTPFSFTLIRQDGEANPEKIAVHLPQGLLAKLKGVPLCPEGDAATGACPPSSRLGSLTASSGVGGAPLWIPQPGKAPTAAYLAGPYKGAPYSIVSVVPAQAGPFDLGLVVNRAGIQVDPDTALASVVTDPLPQFLEGVPITYRTINVLIDRPEFTINPTSCRPKQITATVTAVGGQTAKASDGFQATQCSRLPYSPKLKIAFNGQMRRTGNPGVRATLTQKPGQANTAAATVILPPSQFIDNSHISNPCTRVQFAAEACPPKSVLGTVKARTPLLAKPLRGKVYFRSNGGDRELPDLVADLRGQLRIILVGYIDSVNGRVRTRFLGVPDAPVTSFSMKLFGGDRGLIENSENLCTTKPRLELHLKAQNGRSQASKPRVGLPPCGKPKGKS
ncbi:MAG TPA: hypothetical protein VNC16_07125 [Solirubrobacterales bacterium]|jgi:hypothetical protein|nr:hypothetical protein [Solirubrobacterales bacterium]